MLKLKTTLQHRFNKTVIFVINNKNKIVKFDYVGIGFIDCEKLEITALLNSDNSLSLIDEKNEYKKELETMKLKDLKSLCESGKLPTDKWLNLNKQELIEYILENL